jgi:hypothetical protein
VGIGAIELDGGPHPWPRLILADRHDGLAQLLSDALVGRAEALTRARAA